MVIRFTTIQERPEHEWELDSSYQPRSAVSVTAAAAATSSTKFGMLQSDDATCAGVHTMSPHTCLAKVYDQVLASSCMEAARAGQRAHRL